MPTILTKAIDTIHRNKNKFFEEYGEVRCFYSVNFQCLIGVVLEVLFSFEKEGISAEKQAISLLSKLRNEVQTDKPLLELMDGLSDTESWNQYMQRQQRQLGDQELVSWFKSPWLYVECYMYRRIQEAIWLK